MNRKILAMIMAWVLVLQVISGVGVIPASAETSAGAQEATTVTVDTYGESVTPGGSSSIKAKESILTKVTVKDLKGTVIDAVYNPQRQERSKLGDVVTLEYEWTLENGHVYTDGDKFEFDIPQEFTIYSTIKGQLIADGLSFGEFTVDTSGHVLIVFNSNVDRYSEVSGKLEIQTELSTETIKGSVEVPIRFPIRGGEQVAIIEFEPKDGTPLKKSGTADKDTKIDWTLDINTSLDTIYHAVVTDKIPQGLTLDPDSIHVYELKVNLDREPDLGTEVTGKQDIYTVEADGSELRLKFAKPSIDSAYRVVYSTPVTGEEETSFTNNAELRDKDGIVTTESKTVTIKREKLVTKEVSGYDQAAQTVSWAVKYNYGNKSIPQDQAIIKDRFDDSMTLVDGSVKVYAAQTDEEVDASLYNMTPVSGADGKNGLDLQFKNGINSAYDIKYETQVTDRVYEDTTVTNSVYAELGGKETESSARHTFRSGIGVKSVDSIDYNTKEITWKIVVNRDQWPMTNLVIEDKFTGGGLEFIPDSLSIVSSGEPVVDYTLDDSKPEEGFKLSYAKTFDDTYTITYKTSFTPGKSDYGNTAVLDWTERMTQHPDSVTVEAPFNPNEYTQNNGYKNGKYDPQSKKITWNVIADYNGYSINKAVFTDELEEGQLLDTDSVKVYRAVVQPDGSVQKGTAVNLAPGKIVYCGNLLTIDLGNITEPYWIAFDTKLEKTLVAKDIPNTAVLTGEDGSQWSWSSKVTIPHGEVYVGKSGARNGKLIDWKIKINEGQSYVKNARLVDTPSSNQILVKDSFKLYKGTVAANGDVTPGELLAQGKDYSIIFHYDEGHDQESFELTFVGPIDTAYVLQYSSEIAVSADREHVTNKVGFTGDSVTVGTQDTEYDIEIRTSSGSGSGVGVRGTLIVTKVDKEDPAHKLAGAKYELRGSDGKAVGEKVTNELGQITFTKLLYDTYTLEETKAPEGYMLDKTAHPVTIDSSVQQTGGVKSITLTNEKSPQEPEEPGNPGGPEEPGNPGGPGEPGSPGGPGEPEAPEYLLEIIKVDSEHPSLVLAEAVFVLKDQEGHEKPKTVTTDSYGKAVFTGLHPGTYTLEETAAPAGYKIENAVREIMLGSESTQKDDTHTLTITIANRKETVPPVNPGQSNGPGHSHDDDDDNTDPGKGTGSDTGNSDQDTGTGPNPSGDKPIGTAPHDADAGTTPSTDQGSRTGADGDHKGGLPDSDAGGGLKPSGHNGVDTTEKQYISDNNVLPQTGEGSALPVQLTGLAILLLGIWLKFRKKQSKE
jgi:LPXTG-motif cell wall-anchored protein